MTAFRAFLVAMFLGISVYTALVVAEYGLTLFSVFFGDLMKLNWPGQFNLDFACMLAFSGLWTAWRNEFSAAGLALGVLACLFGSPFLSVYLFVLLAQSQGDLRVVLLGRTRAAQ